MAKKFEYNKRSVADVQKRQEQSGGIYDNPFKEGFPVYLPKIGDQCIRILPPTWEGAKHYGFDIFLHSKIGADNGRFVCPKLFAGKVCPICVEMEAARRSGDGDYAYQLKAKKRVAVWIIDRNNEKAGPQLYPMPWMFDRAISAISVDKKTKEVYYLDSPDEGFDVDFSLIKDGQYTKETGLAVARQSTPISDDEAKQEKWLEYIAEHPIPECVLIRDADYITKVMSGGVKPEADGEETGEEQPQTRSSVRSKAAAVDEEEETPRRRSKPEPEETEDETPVPVAKKKPAVIEDSEEELDEPTPVKKKPKPVVEEEEDETPAPAPKPKVKPKVVEPEEEEEDETPAPVAKKKPVATPVEEDEDETPPARPGPLKKRPVVEEDDED